MPFEVDETTGTPSFVEDHKEARKEFGIPFGHGGFKVMDMGAEEKTFSTCNEDCDLRGGVDARMVPFGIHPISAGVPPGRVQPQKELPDLYVWRKWH